MSYNDLMLKTPFFLNLILTLMKHIILKDAITTIFMEINEREKILSNLYSLIIIGGKDIEG